MGDFLKALLIGVPLGILCTIGAVLALWMFLALLINFPKTFVTIILLIFAVSLGYTVLDASRG